MKNVIEKYPFISGIILVILTMVLPWGLMYPLSNYLDTYLYGGLKYLASLVIAALLIFLIYKDMPFEIKKGFTIKALFTFGLLGIIGAIMPLLFSYEEVDITPTALTIVEFIFYVLMIAVSEEFIFRVVILNLMLKKFSLSKKDILKAKILASIIFGIRHFLNLITMPATPISTTAQVVFTFMAGVYLCALYLRTRSIWICVLIHFLEDFSSLFWGVLSTGALTSSNEDGEPLMMLGMVVIQSVYVLFGVLMIRDKNFSYQSLERIKR